MQKTTHFFIALLFLTAVLLFAIHPDFAYGQTIPTRTPTPSAPDPTATRPDSGGGGGSDPTSTPETGRNPTATPEPNNPTATPNTGSNPTATAVSSNPTPVSSDPTPVSSDPTPVSSDPTPVGSDPTATLAADTGGSGQTAATATATLQPIGADAAPEEGYPEPPSADPDASDYPGTESYPSPSDGGETAVIGSDAEQAFAPTASAEGVVGSETAVDTNEPATALTETTSPASGAPNLLPLVGLVLLASGVFGIIFWRRRNSEEDGSY